MAINTQGLTQGDFLNKCGVMLTGAQANPDVPGVKELLSPFAAAIGGANEAQSERAAQRAQSQQSSRKLDENLTTASDIYSRLRRIFHAYFGPRSEKLAEFGLLPVRPAQKAKPNPQSPAKAQSAIQAATSAADSST